MTSRSHFKQAGRSCNGADERENKIREEESEGLSPPLHPPTHTLFICFVLSLVVLDDFSFPLVHQYAHTCVLLFSSFILVGSFVFLPLSLSSCLYWTRLRVCYTIVSNLWTQSTRSFLSEIKEGKREKKATTTESGLVSLDHLVETF